MRELKFRVWDTRAKSFLFEDFHLLGEVMCFSLIDSWLSEHSFNLPSLERYNDLVFQQFIGLKDKNNKDIYEGDIINASVSFNGGTNEYDIGIDLFFEIKNGLIEYSGLGFMCKKEDLPLDTYKNIEVIGNIFENPELLK